MAMRYIDNDWPILYGRDAAIARAAEKAGFNTSNWNGLICLIDAVINADYRALYPDYYDGPAMYPGQWAAANLRRRHGVLYDYRVADSRPCVPEFVVPAAKIIDNLSRNAGIDSNMHPSRRKHMTVTTTRASIMSRITTLQAPAARIITGANSEPLSNSKGQKRYVDENSFQYPNIKKAKRTHFDHQDSRSPLGDITNTPIPSTPVPSSLNVRQQTTRLFQKLIDQLHVNEKYMEEDLDSLRKQWEVDEGLQYEDVTEHLMRLRDELMKIQEGIKGAIDVSSTIKAVTMREPMRTP